MHSDFRKTTEVTDKILYKYKQKASRKNLIVSATRNGELQITYVISVCILRHNVEHKCRMAYDEIN